MVPQYRIHVLLTAKMQVNCGLLSIGGDIHQKRVTPINIFYIEGGPRKIVMDTGIPRVDDRWGLEGGGEQGVRDALARVGITPEEVDILVLSHLHHDHAGNFHLFRNARVFVQRSEYDFAQNPIPTMRFYYDPAERIRELEKMDLVIVDGDVPIAEGVRAIHLPGHTPGNQGLVVNTKKGDAVLTGDQIYMLYNLCPHVDHIIDAAGERIPVPCRPDLPFMPMAVHTDLVAWFDSMYKVVANASSRSLIIPTHEATHVGRVFGE